MKKNIVMFVYGDIVTDARVQRAATALSDDYDVTLLSCESGKKLPSFKFENILLRSSFKNGTLKMISIIIQALRIIKKRNPDCVYAHDYFAAILLYFLRITFSKKPVLIYDSH